MFLLPSVIKTHIYEYDDTYRLKFLDCITEISILNTRYIAHHYFKTRLFGVKEDIHSLELFPNYFTYKHKNVPYMIQIHHYKDNEYDLYGFLHHDFIFDDYMIIVDFLLSCR